MKIRFIGHKKLMTITLPVGAPKKQIKSRVSFSKGSVVDLDEQDALSLLEVNTGNQFERADQEKVTELPSEIQTKEIDPGLETLKSKRGRPKKTK